MTHEFRATRRVEFSETDLAGIVHFSNFFRYMETVEHAFWRSLGHSVILRDFDPPLGFPRVHAACDYKRPLHFEDVVEMHLLVAAKSARSLSFQIRFRRLEPGPPVDVASGRLTVVCVAKGPDGRFAAVPIPPSVADRIGVAPAELLDQPLA